jgi:predicted aspartyl protease
VSARIVEQFTFRSGSWQITIDDATIDTGADRTTIPARVVDALLLKPVGSVPVGVADGRSSRAQLYRCVVAWTIYEHQRFWLELDVQCFHEGPETLIGRDFTSHFGLIVEPRGLRGPVQPPTAEPLTGGGLLINAPPGYVRSVNGWLAANARPGEVLRPHPSWRFDRPALVKGGKPGDPFTPPDPSLAPGKFARALVAARLSDPAHPSSHDGPD